MSQCPSCVFFPREPTELPSFLDFLVEQQLCRWFVVQTIHMLHMLHAGMVIFPYVYLHICWEFIAGVMVNVQDIEQTAWGDIQQITKIGEGFKRLKKNNQK